MGYDHTAPRRPVSVSLNEDLLRQASRLTDDLSGTLEKLLADYVAARERRADLERQIDEHIAASNAFIEKYGSAADEFGTL